MKKNKIIYWIATGLFSLMILGGASMYIFDHEGVSEKFTELGYPTYLIYLMATTKILGVAAILSNISQFVKQWAYFGFIVNLGLAIFSHIAVGDGEQFGPVVPLILLTVSIIFNQKIQKNKA